MILWVIVFFLSGALLFSLVAGFFFFKQMLLRPQNVSSVNKETISAALTSLQQSIPAEEIEGVKMQGSGNLASHLNDKKIMIPLLQAKLRWIIQYEEGKLEQIKIKNTEGIELSGFFVMPKDNPEYIAVLLHGYTDSALGLAYLAEEYLAHNCAVLAIDSIAHGFSGGNYITMGYKEAKDINLWIEEINKIFQLPSQQNAEDTNLEHTIKIILHGISMGAATVIQSLAEKNIELHSESIALVVADCGFASFKEQLKVQISSFLGKNFFQRGIASLLVFGMSIINFCLNGFFFYKNSPQKALSKRQKMNTSKIPLVIFHGTEDTFINKQVTESLEKAAKGNININLVDHAPHIGSYFYEPKKYMQRIFHSIKE